MRGGPGGSGVSFLWTPVRNRRGRDRTPGASTAPPRTNPGDLLLPQLAARPLPLRSRLRSSRTRSRSTCTSSSASVGRHPQAWLAAHAPRDRRLFSYEDLSGEPLGWKVTGPVGRNCKLSPAGIVFRFPSNWTSKMTVSPDASSISTRHGAALSGRASMML